MIRPCFVTVYFPDSLVYDLIYNPEETVLLKLAKEAGARTLGRAPNAVYFKVRRRSNCGSGAGPRWMTMFSRSA